MLTAAMAGAEAAQRPMKPPLEHAMMGVANGCFVETVAFLDHWKEKHGTDAWARLLQWGAREDEEVVMGHAVGVCQLHDVLWSWDINFGWRPLTVSPTERDHAAVVAVPIVAAYTRIRARYPTFRFDFPQNPAASAPKARLAEANSSIRDASLVGQTLARHRPVNVVVFSWGRAEEPKKESAAAVFVFHGRYCVYVPELGTVPFRARTSVENLRTIQELLRRGLPGVTNLRKL